MEKCLCKFTQPLNFWSSDNQNLTTAGNVDHNGGEYFRRGSLHAITHHDFAWQSPSSVQACSRSFSSQHAQNSRSHNSAIITLVHRIHGAEYIIVCRHRSHGFVSLTYTGGSCHKCFEFSLWLDFGTCVALDLRHHITKVFTNKDLEYGLLRVGIETQNIVPGLHDVILSISGVSRFIYHV